MTNWARPTRTGASSDEHRPLRPGRRARRLRRRRDRGDRWRAAARDRADGDRGAEIGVAPRRGRCRRQDRRRRRHPCADPARLLRGLRPQGRPGAQPRQARHRHDLPAAHRPRQAGDLPRRGRARDPELRLHHLWLAPGAGEYRHHRREGQRHAPRDRTDHDRQQQGRQRGDLRDRPLCHPPPHRARGAPTKASASSTCARCPAARSSTRACSWPSS